MPIDPADRASLSGDANEDAHFQREYARLLALPLVDQILRELAESLPSDLTYHSAAHTIDVLQETVRFAVHDGLSSRECELLAVAAAYHDAGFLVQPVDNELIGADRASEAMRKAGGFTEEEIAQVRSMILDTKLDVTGEGVQHPSSSLAGYLLDADLGNLGRNDFWEKSELYRKELGAPAENFFGTAEQLLERHSYHTPAARELRNDQKLLNLIKLRERRGSLVG